LSQEVADVFILGLLDHALLDKAAFSTYNEGVFFEAKGVGDHCKTCSSKNLELIVFNFGESMSLNWIAKILHGISPDEDLAVAGNCNQAEVTL
jgi:hypothetical protein